MNRIRTAMFLALLSLMVLVVLFTSTRDPLGGIEIVACATPAQCGIDNPAAQNGDVELVLSSGVTIRGIGFDLVLGDKFSGTVYVLHPEGKGRRTSATDGEHGTMLTSLVTRDVFCEMLRGATFSSQIGEPSLASRCK